MSYTVNRILMAAADILPVAVVLVPAFFLLNKALFRNAGKRVRYCIFAFYLAAIYVLVGMPNVTYVRLELNLNLIPIIGMIDDWKNSILNVLLFVPLGVMLPVLWRPYRKPQKTILFGFGMSLAIEVLQIFTLRATDVNDLITNVLGTCLGFLFTNGLIKRFPAIREMGKYGTTGELYIVFSLVFAVMFFLQPILSAVLWDWIL